MIKGNVAVYTGSKFSRGAKFCIWEDMHRILKLHHYWIYGGGHFSRVATKQSAIRERAPLGSHVVFSHHHFNDSMVNNNKMPQETKPVIDVYVYNFSKLGPLTTKLGTLIHCNKFSSKQKIQVSK